MKIKELEKTAFNSMKDEFNYKNIFETPRLEKVVINIGINPTKLAVQKDKQDIIINRLTKITGQKPSPRQAKKSIAGFKIREGQIIGYSITLRNQRMYDFLDKLINVALPRTKDFRGIAEKAIDDMGNFTFGIKEHIIFPEVVDEELKNVFSFSITVVLTKNNKKQAKAFYKHIGWPFEKK
jgi:large subunit ribosomal protein L5